MKKDFFRFLPVAAVLLTASCTDDQYDLSNVDTESRFTAKGLVVPLNMSPIFLDKIISIEEDGDIKKDAEGNYFFQKKCDEPFKSDVVNVEKITITKPVNVVQTINVAIALPEDVLDNWEQYAADKTIGYIKGDGKLMRDIGIDENTNIISVDIEDAHDFNMSASNIDEKITNLDKLGIDPLQLNISVKLDGLQAVVNEVSVEDLAIELPHGMTVGSVSDGGTYSEGKMSFPTLGVNRQKDIQATVTELIYEDMKDDGAKFDAADHKFVYNKKCKARGKASISFGDLKDDATLTDIKNAVRATYSCNVGFSDDITVNKFSGGIKHMIDDISIDPVSIDNLPEILQETGTNIEVANPQLYLDIDNPFNIEADARLRITGNSTFNTSLKFVGGNNKKVLSPQNANLVYVTYKWEEFSDFGRILTGDKIPEKLQIEVVKPSIDGKVTDFELGKDKYITGSWEFYTNLSLTGNSRIKYTKTWDDWQSEDLNGLTVESATVSFNVKKDVALDAESIDFYLMGENQKGEKIELKNKERIVLERNEQELVIPMTAGPVTNIYGGRLVVNLKGKGSELNKNQKIEISNLRMKVDGYYDKEL